MTEATVGVVGAGITGLSLVHYLTERDVAAVDVDAAGEPGGVISTVEKRGRVLEEGPQRMRETPAVGDLLADLDLEDAAIEADESLPLFVYADGRLGEAPMDPRTLLRTDLLSWRGKLRLIAEPLTDAGDPGETAAELFTRKFGREAYKKFVGPLYGGIYGSDPARMPARYALEGLLEREQEAGSLLSAFRQRVGSGSSFPPLSFDDGMQKLPRVLAAAHEDRVHLDRPATAIEARDTGGYRVVTPDGDVDLEQVVVTTPADVAGDLLADVATGTDGLGDMTYNPLAIVHLLADSDREGFGYQVGYGEDLHTLGASWNASMFDREGVYTIFLGGMHDPALVDESDERLEEIAAREFETVMGTAAEPINVARLDRGFPAYDETWQALDDLETPEGVHLATNYTARMGVPSRIGEAKTLAESIADGDGGT